MRIAAGFILIIWGTAGFASGLTDLLLWWSRVTPWKVVILALLVVTVGGGISAIRKRPYWWAFSGAVGLVLAGIIAAAFQWQYTWFLTSVVDPAIRVLMAAAAASAYGIPGLLALIFLAKRKGEFQS
jgi:hypothetical protein